MVYTDWYLIKENREPISTGINKTVNKLDLLGVIWLWDVKGIILAPLILIKIIGPTRFLLHNKKQDNYVYVKNNAQKRLVLEEIFIFFLTGFFFNLWLRSSSHMAAAQNMVIGH